jgi:hypothetical protein
MVCGGRNGASVSVRIFEVLMLRIASRILLALGYSITFVNQSRKFGKVFSASASSLGQYHRE